MFVWSLSSELGNYRPKTEYPQSAFSTVKRPFEIHLPGSVSVGPEQGLGRGVLFTESPQTPSDSSSWEGQDRTQRRCSIKGDCSFEKNTAHPVLVPTFRNRKAGPVPGGGGGGWVPRNRKKPRDKEEKAVSIILHLITAFQGPYK